MAASDTSSLEDSAFSETDEKDVSYSTDVRRLLKQGELMSPSMQVRLLAYCTVMDIRTAVRRCYFAKLLYKSIKTFFHYCLLINFALKKNNMF